MNSSQPPARPTALWTRRGLFISLAVAVVLELIAIALGLSDGGFGWAFQMPIIALLGLGGMTLSVGGLILGILRLIHRRGRDVPVWIATVIIVFTGIAGLLLAALAVVASASV